MEEGQDVVGSGNVEQKQGQGQARAPAAAEVDGLLWDVRLGPRWGILSG